MASKLEAEVRELQQEVSELKDILRKIIADTPSDVIGSRTQPLRYFYYMDPNKRSASYRVSVDFNGGTPQLRFEVV